MVSTVKKNQKQRSNNKKQLYCQSTQGNLSCSQKLEGLCRNINSHTLINMIMQIILKYIRLVTSGNESCKVAWSSSIVFLLLSQKSLPWRWTGNSMEGQLGEMKSYNQNDRITSIYKRGFLWKEMNRQILFMQ